MGSRIRDNPKQFFECFCEVVCPKHERQPWIIQKFPDSFSDEEVLKSVPEFAFPCEFESTSVQHYSFVLTNIDSKWTFGFCRHTPSSETALVMLSFLPWHDTFYKLLNHVADLTHSTDASGLWDFLHSLYNVELPEPGSQLLVMYGNGTKHFVCQCPDHHRLPSIPENRNLMEYFNAIDAHNMMIVFASMLYERRIIITSRRMSRLSACIQAANSVIYPMSWQHIFIPVLPKHLVDYLSAPMPFLIGVPQVLMQRVKRGEIGEAVILDADSNQIDSPFQDLDSFPSEIVTTLKRHLKTEKNLLGDHVARCFLHALVQLIGGYRDALKFRQGEKITFNKDAFLKTRPANMQPFLEKMLQLQIFQQFIEERLEMLNSGQGFSDEFELEACAYAEKSSSRISQQYREWKANMRKEGGAFFKNVKNKANPAMKSAVRTVKRGGKNVKERGQTVYKDFRHRIREFQTRDAEALPSTSPTHRGDQQSHSAPSSPVQEKRRPITIAGRPIVFKKENVKTYVRGESQNIPKVRQYNPLSPDDISSPYHIPPINTDLMGEMEDLIFRKFSDLSGEKQRNSSRSMDDLDPAGRTGTSMGESDLFGSVPFVETSVPSSVSSKPKRPTLPPKPNVCNGTQGADPVVLPPPQSKKRAAPVPALPASTTRQDSVPLQNRHSSSDLIRLDSETSPTDVIFDPLLLKDNNHGAPTNLIYNPLYNFHVPPGVCQSGTLDTLQGHSRPESCIQFESPRHVGGQSEQWSSSKVECEYSSEQDLLREFGLDFSKVNLNTRRGSKESSPASAGIYNGLSPVRQEQHTNGNLDMFDPLAQDGTATAPSQPTRPIRQSKQWTTFE